MSSAKNKKQYLLDNWIVKEEVLELDPKVRATISIKHNSTAIPPYRQNMKCVAGWWSFLALDMLCASFLDQSFKGVPNYRANFTEFMDIHFVKMYHTAELIGKVTTVSHVDDRFVLDCKMYTTGDTLVLSATATFKVFV